MTVGENIKRLREEHGMTQESFGKIADVSSMAVSQWENDRAVPRMGAIQRLSDYFEIPKSQIIDASDMFSGNYGERRGAPGMLPRRSRSAAPIVGDVAAGEVGEAYQVTGGELTLPDGIAERHPHACFLRVSGESMNRLFNHGEYVLYDPDEEVRDGDVAVVYVNGDEATVKRVYFAGDTVVLHPESTVEEYRDRAIDTRDPASPPVTFAGKVVWKTLGDAEVRF